MIVCIHVLQLMYSMALVQNGHCPSLLGPGRYDGSFYLPQKSSYASVTPGVLFSGQGGPGSCSSIAMDEVEWLCI